MADPATAAPPEKLEHLRTTLREMGSVLVCYSGGIDSALVLAVATEQLGPRAVGMTAVSASLAPREKDEAARIAAQLGADHRLVESHEIERPGYVANGPDRCFHCKTELYDIARAQQHEWDLAVVVNGTNVEDLGDYRPGLRAADDAGVRSPLVEVGMTKADVREAAHFLGIEIWNKPAAACLSSRIPYGTSVTPERLGQIAELEAALKTLGFEQLRVRYHGPIARIEVALEELPRLVEDGIRDKIVEAGKQAGFSYVTMDLGGYRRGSHNEMLTGRSLRVVS